MQALRQKGTLVDLLIFRKNDCPDLRRDRYLFYYLAKEEGEEAVLLVNHHQAHLPQVLKRKSNCIKTKKD